jgi:hypothetical protein
VELEVNHFLEDLKNVDLIEILLVERDLSDEQEAIL